VVVLEGFPSNTAQKLASGASATQLEAGDLKAVVNPARFPGPPCASPLGLGLSGSSVGGDIFLMGKKKISNAQTSKTTAKAAKKAKAAQKTERKEKKKSGKAKDEFDDDQDLEGILENVPENFAFTSPGLANGELASRSAGNGKRHTLSLKSLWKDRPAVEPMRH
jgi:hypothetical protein